MEAPGSGKSLLFTQTRYSFFPDAIHMWINLHVSTIVCPCKIIIETIVDGHWDLTTEMIMFTRRLRLAFAPDNLP